MMQWRKDPDLKYTDLCIYIDENVEKIRNPGEYKDIEDKIYNYLWLLVKALAIKKRMFNSFQDYDGYSFYAANRLFFALRKNLQNQGKVIKGKFIKPIKSCLNYTKALLYPMKLEYLNKTYNMALGQAAIDQQYNSYAISEQLKNQIQDNQTSDFEFLIAARDILGSFSDYVDKTLEKSPFTKGTVDYKKLKISIMLNCLMNLKDKKGIDFDPVTVQLWKLPKSMASYVRVLLKELAALIKQDLVDSYQSTRIEEPILEYMLTNPDGEFVDHED